MPANAIEKIEIITQPGAEFPATSGGATHYYQQKTRKLFECYIYPAAVLPVMMMCAENEQQ
jgi:hypothetical protein